MNNFDRIPNFLLWAYQGVVYWMFEDGLRKKVAVYLIIMASMLAVKYLWDKIWRKIR